MSFSFTLTLNGFFFTTNTDFMSFFYSIPDGRWRCARRVSTILCVHQQRCRPANCSGHGDCMDGLCRCHAGWQGAACDSLVCQPSDCGPHGICTDRKCSSPWIEVYIGPKHWILQPSCRISCRKVLWNCFNFISMYLIGLIYFNTYILLVLHIINMLRDHITLVMHSERNTSNGKHLEIQMKRT